MGQEPKEFLKELRQILDDKVMEAGGYRLTDGGREMSLVITKLQEARLWAEEALGEI